MVKCQTFLVLALYKLIKTSCFVGMWHNYGTALVKFFLKLIAYSTLLIPIQVQQNALEFIAGFSVFISKIYQLYKHIL